MLKPRRPLRKVRLTLTEKIRTILPGQTIGIVGAGQLGQMLGSSAVEMGYSVISLDPTPHSPASKVGEQIIAGYNDPVALHELADNCEVLTYEFENVSAETIKAAGGHLPQGTRSLEICKDRLVEKAFLGDAGVPVAPYAAVSSSEDLHEAIASIGLPAVLKTTRGGYDGKGQVVIHTAKDVAKAEPLLAVPCVLESWIPFTKEVSVIVAGDQFGTFVCFPVGENEHRNNILHTTTVPARVDSQTEALAKRLALTIAEKIGLVGVMGVEMFVVEGGKLFVNELAPRPHNSGHYTIEACDFSQFDLHIRAICGLPIIEPRLLSPSQMTNVLGQDLDDTLSKLPHNPDWSLHLYGKKEAKTDRKMGHITVLTNKPLKD